MNPDSSQLVARLRSALADEMESTPVPEAPLRGPRRVTLAGQRRWKLIRDFASELSYGRHAGPPAPDARLAAVLVLLYPKEDEWHVLLTLRPTHLPTHAGQISFPGGAMEPGETFEQCAAREWYEELGEPGVAFTFVGRLPPLYVFASNYVVTPCVAVAEQSPVWSANLHEVADVIQLPLHDLWDDSRFGEHYEQRGSLVFRAPHIMCHGYRIWGATALVLGELLSALGEGW